MKKIIYSFFVIVTFIFSFILSNLLDVYASTTDYTIDEVYIDNNVSSKYPISTLSSGGNDYYWENTGTSLPKEVDYGDETLLKHLKRGDIIFEKMSATNHAAIVEGIFYDETYDQYYVRVIESVKNGGVCRGIVTPERMEEKEGSVYRLTNASKEQINGAFEFIYEQLGENYEIAIWKNPDTNNVDWYCSELIWSAYYHQGIYLDVDDNDVKGSIVWPEELIDHDFAIMVASYEYETISTPLNSTEHKIRCNNDELIVEHNYIPHNDYTDICYSCGLLSSKYTTNYEFGVLNCRSNEISKTNFRAAGEYLMYQIKIDCAKNYSFCVTTFSSIDLSLYDSNQNPISFTVNKENNECTANFNKYLNKGIYYLRIKFIDIDASENFTLTGKPSWQSSGTEVLLGDNIINTHMHKTNEYELDNLLYFINSTGPSFYKFTIEATKIDGTTVTYPSETLQIYDHMDEYQEVKYNVKGHSQDAESVNGNNYLYMYLERNGYYYIHVNMLYADYLEIKINIEKVDVNKIEVASRFDEAFTEILINSSDMIECATGFTIDQTSAFTLSAIAGDTYIGNITLILFKKEFNSDTRTYYKTDIIGKNLIIADERLILEEGTYYIGYFGNISNVPVTVTINRIVTTSEITDKVLVMDPNINLTYGTEVRYNGGEIGGTTITEGFTRHIHFQNVTGVPSVSRYDYNFYSSNKSYATVSEFGTVFAKSVTDNKTVTITAVYKYNPSIIFTIELTILNDTSNTEKIIETYQTIKLADFVNDKYKLVLDETNSAYPWIQYYKWSIYVPCQKEDILVTIDEYGYLTTSGAGSVILTGRYSINPNVIVIVNINFE